MKTLIIECKFTIEVPWDEQYGEPHFQIEENSCPGTSAVNGVLSPLMEAAEENSICWACMVGGENKILRIEDREPRNYVDEITFKESSSIEPCGNCGNPVNVSIKTNASNVIKHSMCEACGRSTDSMDMQI